MLRAKIGSIVAACGRCGFECRAMTGDGVAVAYPDRVAWAKLCWRGPTARDPLSCPELVRALAAVAKKAAATTPLLLSRLA